MKKITSEVMQAVVYMVGFVAVAFLLEGTVDIVEKMITALLAYALYRVMSHFIIKAGKDENP